MTLRVAIAGGGIGGLAATLALSHANQQVELFEKATAFSEIGAGIQLGPNVCRILSDWGLLDAVRQTATAPERLKIRSTSTGGVLGELRLGEVMTARYGAPYLTLRRADLHAVLLQAVHQTSAAMHLDRVVCGFEQTPRVVSVNTGNAEKEFAVLVGADGLWSNIRHLLLGDGQPRRTGHLALRALIKQTELPQRLRCQNVTAWLGASMHVVQYPVHAGEWLNIVAFVHGDVPDDFQNWDHSANVSGLKAALEGSSAALRETIQAAANWRLWVMHDRPPMQGKHQHAQGRVALLGDAAHPMRPYLAQGAGMAIEDAAALGQALLGAGHHNAQLALQNYASSRWRRNARVQARALRNGQIFHATGLLRQGRDAAMKLMGERLLDLPWLYGFK